MSDKGQTEGHWESHSYASRTTQVGDSPAVTVGKEASAQGTFDVRQIVYLCTIHFLYFYL